MTHRIVLLLVLGAFLLNGGCRSPKCTCHDPVLNASRPDSEAYTLRLANLLEATDQTTLSFWFTGYEEKEGNESMIFRVKGETLCAEMRLRVEDWTMLNDLRSRKGVSYRGAEFVNLQYDIRRDSSGTAFIFRKFDRIID